MLRKEQIVPHAETVIPPGYEYLANYIISQEEIVLHDPNGDSVLVYPFNILLACSRDKYLSLHVSTAAGIDTYVQRATKEFTDQLPADLFYESGRFYILNTVRFKGVSNYRRTFRFDAAHLVDIKHPAQPGIEEIIKQKKRLFHASLH